MKTKQKEGTKMPNRILKESICRSEEIDSLSWFQEVLFYRLIVVCDDFGRFDGRTKIIKASCFPLKSVTEKDIDKALGKLSAVGLVRVYEIQGRPYLQLVTWSTHQTIRNQKSKYPAYPSDLQVPKKESQTTENDCEHLKAIENNGMQLQSIESNCSRNPIQSESNPNKNQNPNICSEQNCSEQQPAVIMLKLNTQEEYPITQKNVEEWTELYPAVDVMQCLRNIKGWLNSNPTKRKTKTGILRFINAWLAKEQDRGGRSYAGNYTNYGANESATKPQKQQQYGDVL